MKIFVIGGSGIVGLPTVRALRRKGYGVLALAPTEDDVRILREADADVLPGDVRDENLIAAAARHCDAVIYSMKIRPLADWIAADRLAVPTLLRQLTGSGKRFVYISGANTYGDTGRTEVDETYPPNDPPEYGAWRGYKEMEPLVLRSTQDGVHPIIVKPAQIYGDQRITFRLGWIVDGAAHYVGDGSNLISMVHAHDLADLIVLALERAPAGSIYNASAGRPVKWKELAEAVSRGYGWGGTATSVTVEEAKNSIGIGIGNHTRDICLSSAKALALGWTPKWTDVLANPERWLKD
ncbi:MAG TPA: NAD-dependent epimerase/dehydratase family protein [Magnetospirillaceae bacterium]|jgi:nucleoside-diphosphate-sugar epimerase